MPTNHQAVEGLHLTCFAGKANTILRKRLPGSQTSSCRKDKRRGMGGAAQNPGAGNSLEVISWSKPPEEFSKCNVDAALNVGYGDMLRDSLSVVAAGLSGVTVPPANSVSRKAEAKGSMEALRWLVQRSYQKVLVKIDSQELFYAAQSSGVDLSEWGTLVADCRSLLSRGRIFLFIGLGGKLIWWLVI
ncbi:hypothetical protein GH714_040351 [Hevea brasiliensis]|uniref:RNase H type-1 domain-containing protein n=1 Tax=Hevea brasiliensis TaxID=3981 RepID=A0A6A6MPN1_HEVBR|nr:hypothetical protein GH714_040351 [Hevea brasiliensis]